MAEIETVIVDNDGRRTRSSWIAALIILGLLALFYVFVGFNMMSGSPKVDAKTSSLTPTVTTPVGG